MAGARRKIPAWGVEFLSEHDGPFGYRYRRLSVERLGRRASVREFVFEFETDAQGRLDTPANKLVRQRGRSLSTVECDVLWSEVQRLRPRLRSLTLSPDGLPGDPEEARAPDGLPIAVHLGEEGPACVALREGRVQDDPELRRVLIARNPREIPRCDGDPTPTRELIALLDPGLHEKRALSYRRSRAAEDLCTEFRRLKARDFLNLRRFELRVLEALAWLADPAGVPTLSSELFAPDPHVRLLALEALSLLAPADVRRDVELLCHDDDPRVRERARDALRSAGG